MENPDRSALELMGKPLPAGAPTRERIIAAALELFYFHGFHAIGIDQIVAAAGVTKTTFYNHFESKDDLMVEAVTRRDQMEVEAWTRAVHDRAQGDPRRMLLAVFDVMDEWFTDPKFLGCIFINAAAEFPSPHDPIHQAARHHKEAYLNILVETAEKAGACKPEELAEQIMLLIDGAITLRHVAGNDHAAKLARNIAEKLLAESLTATA